MMLDAVEFRAHGLAREGLLQQNRDARAGAAIAQPAEHQIDVGALGQEIADLAHEVGATVLIERDVIHVGKLNACLAQAIGDGLGGKSRPMLDAAEPLLLGGRDQLAVAHQRSGRVGVKGVQAENDHRTNFRSRASVMDVLGSRLGLVLT